MILDYEGELHRAEKRRNIFLTVYVAIACVFVAAALLLLFLSSDAYLPYLIGDVLLSVAFGFYSVWFFTVSFDNVTKRRRLVYKVACALENKEFGTFLREEAPMTVDGVKMRVLLFTVRGTEREIHLLEGDFAPQKSKKYLLVTRAGVLIEAREQDE